MKCFLVAVGCLGCLCPLIAAENKDGVSVDSAWMENFKTGERELSVGGVALFSPCLRLERRPAINYAGPVVRLGYMLSDAEDHGAWSGNFEGLVEGYATTIFKGQGDYMAGTTLWIRYNFLPDWKVTPYFQGGAGLTFTDVDRNVLGQTFNFNLNLALGVRYFINPRCSVNAEYRYQHVSNAGMSDVNLGVDAQGGMLSVSWFY